MNVVNIVYGIAMFSFAFSVWCMTGYALTAVLKTMYMVYIMNGIKLKPFNEVFTNKVSLFLILIWPITAITIIVFGVTIMARNRKE